MKKIRFQRHPVSVKADSLLEVRLRAANIQVAFEDQLWNKIWS